MCCCRLFSKHLRLISKFTAKLPNPLLFGYYSIFQFILRSTYCIVPFFFHSITFGWLLDSSSCSHKNIIMFAIIFILFCLQYLCRGINAPLPLEASKRSDLFRVSKWEVYPILWWNIISFRFKLLKVARFQTKSHGFHRCVVCVLCMFFENAISDECENLGKLNARSMDAGGDAGWWYITTEYCEFTQHEKLRSRCTHDAIVDMWRRILWLLRICNCWKITREKQISNMWERWKSNFFHCNTAWMFILDSNFATMYHIQYTHTHTQVKQQINVIKISSSSTAYERMKKMIYQYGSMLIAYAHTEASTIVWGRVPSAPLKCNACAYHWIVLVPLSLISNKAQHFVLACFFESHPKHPGCRSVCLYTPCL